MTNREYGDYVKKKAAPSPLAKNGVLAFCAGGLICVLGELLLEFYQNRGMGQDEAGTAVSVTLIALSALLTALGLYDRIASWAGAGTLVPITGFANSMVSPAVEFKTEGFITGTAVKMFSIAGPVIVYGVVSSVLYGVILALLGTA